MEGHAELAHRETGRGDVLAYFELTVLASAAAVVLACSLETVRYREPMTRTPQNRARSVWDGSARRGVLDRVLPFVVDAQVQMALR